MLHPNAKRSSRLALCLAVGYASLLLVLLPFEDSFVFHPYPPSKSWIDPPADLVVQDVFLATANGVRIHARWYPSPAARGAVLVCHSRAGNLSHAVSPGALRRWHGEVGLSVLVFDY